jgi:branched-chain amino acid transport system permease protein
MMTSLIEDRRFLYSAIVFIIMLFVPTVIHATFLLRMLTEVIMWIGLAISLDVMAGYTGYLNFGHQAFFGAGAYTTAVLMMKANWPFPFAVMAGGVVAAIGAFVVGIPTLRLRGSYFAIAAWALARAIQQFALMTPYTGGPDGMRVTAYLNPQYFFYVMLGVVGATFFTLWFLLERAPFGLKLKAIREDQESAKAIGLNPTHLKMQAFVLSAIPTALLGGIFAYWITFIDPGSVLGDLLSDQPIVMLVFGGMGTLIGPAIGAVLIFALKSLFWAYLSAYELLYIIILGCVIATSVVFLPDGVLGVIFRKGRQRTKSQKALPLTDIEKET